jgi:hypothetical protein
MSVYIGSLEPKKPAQKNGAVTLVYALDAPNKKAAESIIIAKLWEAYPAAGDNYFNPKVVEDQIGSPRPALGIFDEEFAIDNEFNGKNWQPRKIDSVPLTGPIDLLKQHADVKIQAVALFGLADIDQDMLSTIIDILNDKDSPDESGMKDVVSVLISIPAVCAMSPEAINKLIEAIFVYFGDEVPTEPGIRRFTDEWVSNPRDREKLTDVSNNPKNGDSSALPDYDALEKHIALSIMAVHPLMAKASDVKNAKEIIATRDSVWRAWNKTFRIIVGILAVDTDIRHNIISEGLKNPKLLNNDDERLHFVKSRLIGNPACPELTNYRQMPEGETGTATEELKAATKSPVTETKTPIAATEQVNQTIPQMEYTPAPPAHNDLQNRADELEKELASKVGSAAQNLAIWKQVQRTDPTRTKRQDTTNAKGEVTRTITSIKPVYQYMRATEIFGPIGIGWGVDVVEERFDKGIPMMESIIDNAGREIGKKVMRDGDGSVMTSLNHTMKITLWYIHDGQRGEITAYGHTKALYASKYGMTFDDEPSKKSLTDATTKALSSLGFSADVYLGLFEDAEYSQENALEHSIKNASDKADDSVRLRKELDDRFAKNTETMRSAVTKNEVTQIASSLTRTISSHIKSAKSIGDTQHAKYLDSRLIRLEEIKKECLATFDTEKTE